MKRERCNAHHVTDKDKKKQPETLTKIEPHRSDTPKIEPRETEARRDSPHILGSYTTCVLHTARIKNVESVICGPLCGADK